ncbi:MAG: glutamate--tRNA ligase [Pseudomonadota bacterium]
MSQEIVTRFAPSPTGYLHIGGARTALFNWLFAKRHGGKFLLRIEDTDRARHSEEAVDAIIEGLTWLGLTWDSEPVSQFSQSPRHREVAEDLLAKGAAYRCYMSAEEIDAARNTARETNSRFVSPWREADPSTAPEGGTFTIRFKAAETGETIVSDAVQGEVKYPNSALDDLILLRSDGTPTYNLAVVVDDHDMGVTHVIRGDDHLNNAARQQQIYEALGWDLPVFAHIPLIHGQDGAKLSKRHGALGVEAYRDMGILSDALANYLLKLGWAHGDEEYIPRTRALEVFDLHGINKAPARLDTEKLEHLNGQYLNEMDDAAFLAGSIGFLEKTLDADQISELRDTLARAVPFLKDRMKTLADIGDAAGFILAQRPIVLEGKAGKPLRKEGAMDILKDVHDVLANAADWSSPEALVPVIEDFATSRELSMGQFGPPLRAALTGGKPSPSLSEILYTLGKDDSLGRIYEQIQ